uniref:ATP-binding cassette sub-family B member 6 n=1 Tax=Oncorhynchus tshawytscha TaxID=74940 RepID=A0A8C8GKH1_ONCTS
MGKGVVADFGPSELFSGLCHTDTLDPFPVWRDGAISPCFNQLVLGALAHAVVAVFSAFHQPFYPFALHRCSLLWSSPPCGWGLRVASALLVTLLFVVDLVLVVLLHRGDMYLDVLADGCAVLAWLVHFGALLVLQRSIYRRTRGPSVLLLLVLLPIPNLVITLLAYAQEATYLDLVEPFRVARLVLAVTRGLSLLVYLLAFAAPCVGEGSYTSMSVNDADSSLLIPESSYQDTGEVVAEDGSSFISRLMYLWLNPLLRRGRRGELERPCNVYLLPRRLRTTAVHRHFLHCWEDCQQRAATQRRNTTPRPANKSLQNRTWTSPLQQGIAVEEVGLLKVLHKAFGLRYYLLGVLKLAGNMLSFAGPLLLSSLVHYMEEEGAPISQGAWCATGLFFSTFFSALIRNIFAFEVSKVSLSARAALISTIYGKALRVSGGSLAARFTLGEVVNFMSTDTDHVINFFNNFHEVWSLPFQFSIALYLLYLQVGVAFLGGLGVALLLVPLNKVLASKIMENNKHMLSHKDSRVKLMTEVLFGIRVIKFYNWEAYFAQKIADFRRQELSHLKAIKYLDAVCVYTWGSLPIVISIITFVTYVLLGHELTAATVFTTLALVGMLIVPLNSFPWVLNGILEAKVSLDRIQRFLKLPNQDLDAYFSLGRCVSWKSWGLPSYHSKDVVFFFLVCQGSLVVVVGKVGCGKSSLLAAITGELNRRGGDVYVQGREDGFGLAAQEPWIQHATVRDNILFGKDYNSSFYQAVVEACALTDDLNILPNGDRTEVGENGVTLSGGQKARLALARAVYMEKDIFLLDDPLAAVDSDVAHHLMERCIMGILMSKTRILCTHRIEFVDKADVVILMDNGTIIKTGSELWPFIDSNVCFIPRFPVNIMETTAFANMSSEVKFYLTVYCSIAGANTVFTAFRAFLFAFGGIRAASVVHNRLLDTVLKATVTFFDTTPLGRVVNRFSSDLYSVDDTLPFFLNILLASIFGLLGMLVVMSYGLPWFLVALLPLGLLYHLTQRFYRHTSRDLKRLCSLTLSPVYSHFSETLSGLGTIRKCFRERLTEENERRLEQNQRCLFLSNAAMQWLDIRLQMIGVVVVTGISVIAVVQHQFKSIDPGLVGLSLSYALSITGLLSGLIFNFTQTEMQLVSVERTEEYSTTLPTEQQHSNPQVPTSWPEQGWVEFRGAVLSYREGLPNALDGVSLVVRPGEKVGVVGRTGSGKSTLFLALFRMVELNQGQILLDGVDTSQVGLAQLRSKLAIIPQDPFLFSGTVRENLDPCGRHPDPRLLEALEHCHLSAVINCIGGLGAEVGERGKSLSLGQRQLLCLARALLTEANILCIDEATASVDQKTDKLLQQTIRETFQDKTVLTIAHRINTIMDSDRVLVMHSGKVVEFDTPADLCQRDDSIFSELLYISHLRMFLFCNIL